MKYLFFLLILVNIVFYLWETGAGRPAAPADRAQAAAPATEERIVLVKELPKAPGQATEPPASPADAAGRPPILPAPPAAMPAAAKPAGEIPPPPVEETALACYRLGPYATPGLAKAAWRRLGTGRGQAGVVKKPVETAKGYLILYPAADSLEAAQANRKMLAEKGFKDAWLVGQGENRYAISLAALKSKDQAGEALGRYLAQGVQAELKPRLGLADTWWLEVRGASGRAALEAIAGPPAAAADSLSVKACD